MAGMKLLSDENIRLDGRKSLEKRNINCKMGVFKHADGSAYFEIGDTKILAAVYGPHEVTLSRARQLSDKLLINCQYNMGLFSSTEQKLRQRNDKKSIEISQKIKETFDSAILTNLYPKSQIDIFIEVIHSDGSALSASINAASMALTDAGVPSKGLVCSCTSGLVESTPLLDLNHLEESQGLVEMSLATLPTVKEQILMTSINGKVHEDMLERVIDCGMLGCREVSDILSEILRQYSLEMASKYKK